MSQGRKAISKSLKIVQGTHRPTRDNKQAPTVASEIPEMPKGLSTRAKNYWKDLTELLHSMGVITLADQAALEMLCETYSEWKSLCSDIRTVRKGKSTYTTVTEEGSEMIRPLPEFSQRADAARRFQSVLSEFGLTPAARNKVKAIGSKDSGSDPWDAI